MKRPDRQIQGIKITPNLDTVKIKLASIVSVDDTGEEEADNIVGNMFVITGKHRPHKDFVDAMKKLRKSGLELLEITTDSVTDWTVQEISISGDVVMKQSRVVMTLAKKIKRTGKVSTIKTPQTTMYPEKEDDQRFAGAEAMSKLIESCIDEAVKYLNGKYESDEKQLPLFPFEVLETNFDR